MFRDAQHDTSLLFTFITDIFAICWQSMQIINKLQLHIGNKYLPLRHFENLDNKTFTYHELLDKAKKI